MEARLCLSAGAAGARARAASGVDAIAMGDVNGDQVADIAVASHRNGKYEVTLYSGLGQPDSSLASGNASKVLATIDDPFKPAAGPLDVALGDFDGGGLAELAISARNSDQIAVYTFRPNVDASGPLNATVTPIKVGSPFTPSGLNAAKGINVAAVDIGGTGLYQLVAAPAAKGPSEVVVLSYGKQSGWQTQQILNDIPVRATRGLSVSAGDLAGNGDADVVVGSQTNGQVAVYDLALQRWTWTFSPFGTNVKGIRVAVDLSEGVGEAGSIVVTAGQGRSQAVIVPWRGTPQAFQLAASPGPGQYVPLGAGYVFRPSTIVAPTDPQQAPYANGPATPAVFFAATGGSHLVLQDFATSAAGGSSAAQLAPSPADTFVEPLWGDQGRGFIPLQVQSDPDATGQPASTNPLVPRINLVALPKDVYNSPFSIDLSGLPSSITAGLEDTSSLLSTTTDPWGPAKELNAPPTVGALTNADTLRARVIAAYASFLGVDYQHHHDPRWSPTQQGPWNITGTVAYQSQGVDCTNFTAAAYADALGILMPSATGAQASITSNSDIYIPGNSNGFTGPSVAPYIHVQTFRSNDWGGTYQGLVNFLKPGDILFIDGKPGGKVTHAITWLGSYGVDANGKYTGRLVIDSTGITPQHVDSNNRIIPEGVHIRPFLDGADGAPNTWYFKDLDHVLRIVQNPS